jgi:hypothetical protein
LNARRGSFGIIRFQPPAISRVAKTTLHDGGLTRIRRGIAEGIRTAMLRAASVQRCCNDQRRDHPNKHQRPNQQPNVERAHDSFFHPNDGANYIGPQVKKAFNSEGIA